MDDDVQANVYVGPKRVAYSGVVVPGPTLVLHAPSPHHPIAVLNWNTCTGCPYNIGARWVSGAAARTPHVAGVVA